ncbi:MAG: hypothetical protein NWR87_06030 [Rhodospirillales bacterium]|nr:hypothetical protein [Rhodospirillales bacterium]
MTNINMATPTVALKRISQGRSSLECFTNPLLIPTQNEAKAMPTQARCVNQDSINKIKELLTGRGNFAIFRPGNDDPGVAKRSREGAGIA